MLTTAHLDPHEFHPDHPCSDPALYEVDAQLLAYLLQDLRALARRHTTGELALVPHESLHWSVHGLARRTVVCDPVGLARCDRVWIVGFFGERRGDPTTRARIDRLEGALVDQFGAHPALLSYSSIELVDDHWANLVVHRDPEDREEWRRGETHREAAEEASPEHYRSVRIHHGVLEGGVCGSHRIELVRTKYWDYGEVVGTRPWQAVRELI